MLSYLRISGMKPASFQENDHLNVFLSLVYEYFVENFRIYVYKKD